MSRSAITKVMEFPKDFLWGTATASHQVEGNNRLNDWWAFEQQAGRIHDGNPSGDACRHYELYKDDIKLMKSLHQNAHRFSLEWSRIEPEEGKFDAQAIAHYRDVIETLRANNIEPLVTIHHFTNPVWLSKKGAWEDRKIEDYFARYTRIVAREFGDIVSNWVTINEPMVYVLMGYILSHWPPAKKSTWLGFRVLGNMMRAHAAAYRVLHETAKLKPMVGIAHNMRLFDPANPHSWFDGSTAWLQDYLINEIVMRVLDSGTLPPPLGLDQSITNLGQLMDFVGLNYYSRDLVEFNPKSVGTLFGRNFPPPGSELTLFGWEIYPEGLYRLCKRLAKYDKPIFITENGIPDDTDEQRPRALIEHLAAVHKAISEGANVKGYFHWSFIDNFEWAEGYRTPFGLVECDFKTQARRVKDSGKLYAEICRTGQLTPEMRAGVKERLATEKKHFNLYLENAVYANSNAVAGD